MKSERKACAVAFLRAAVAYYKSLGVIVERVMTDNGSCYSSKAFARACRKLRIKHIRTKPYTPRTNGKAEASSKHPCENGPMRAPISTPHSAHTTCASSSTDTTGIDLTPPSAVNLLSAESPYPRTTC
jgi:transposase InsO family protein